MRIVALRVVRPTIWPMAGNGAWFPAGAAFHRRQSNSASRGRTIRVPSIQWTGDREGLSLEQREDGVDGVSLLRPLVRAVTLDSCKAQRHAARIMGAGLNIVERDLDHQFGPHMHDMAVVADGQFLQALRLPLEHRVRHTLEGLSEHDEVPGCLIACTQMQVAEPAAAATMAPFGGKHDEVKRVGPLDLEPAGTAATRLIRCIERLG